MIDIVDKKECCGCTACVNACPIKAITMEPDEEGFFYPRVSSNCVNCGKCDEVCPIKKSNVVGAGKTPNAYVGRSLDKEILAGSTSGGIFSEVAQCVINNNGVVIGASFDDEYKVKHIVAENISDLIKLRGSKYVQSELAMLFSKIKDILLSGKMVCFAGTPCQVAGLKSYLQKEYGNLICIDFICRSIPSPLMWESYKAFLEKKYESKIKEVRFRNKTYGYHNGSFIVKFVNNKVISGSNRVNSYMKSFHNNICSRPSCYDCKFKNIERVSDITLFDCYDAETIVKGLHDDNKGYSGMLIHSKKGDAIIEENVNIEKYPVEINKLLSFTGGMAVKSISYDYRRDSFYKDLNKCGFEIVEEKYVRIMLIDKLIELSKPMLYKLKILR